MVDYTAYTKTAADAKFALKTEIPTGSPFTGDLAPTDLAFKAWSCDPAIIAPGTRVTPTAGQMTGGLITLPAATLTGITYFVGVSGATVTNCYLGLIDATTGNRLAVTADVSSTVTSTGLKRTAFTAPLTASGGLAYAVLLVGTAATMPQFTKLPNTDSAFLNARGPNQPTGRVRAGRITNVSSLTAIPATNDLTTNSALVGGIWCALD